MGLNQLYFRGDYPALIEAAEEYTLEVRDEYRPWSLLAFAHNAVNDSAQAAWVIETNNLFIEPGSEFMTAPADETVNIYIDALQAVRRDAEARDIAVKKDATINKSLTTSWWLQSHRACTLSQLGRTEEALVLVEHVKDVEGLPPTPLLRDSLCFRRLKGDPRYEAVLAELEARQQALRDRLPKTLRDYDVADVRAPPRAPPR
jgi:hypothetical protein